MTTYVGLLRGINVGGKNKVPMAQLREVLAGLGFTEVQTYIQSGNVIFGTRKGAAVAAKAIEQALLTNFTLDSELVRTLVLTAEQMCAVVADAPVGFGQALDEYRYDVAYLIAGESADVAPLMPTHPEIDRVWAGPGVVYYRRRIEGITRSRINKIVGTPFYANLTIRNWNTTVKLAALVG